MRTETITTFYCEKCGTGYRSQRLAEHCESGALPSPPLEIAKGQKIWIAVDHQMDAAQFGNWDYSASLSNTETTEEEHKSHIDWLLTRDPKHNLEIQLLEPHYYSEYGDQTRASLHSTALEKYADKSITGNEIFCAKTEWYD